jgi:cytochrome c biogenesis protein CcmG, thiol:disulfide interchange protein DsbE
MTEQPGWIEKTGKDEVLNQHQAAFSSLRTLMMFGAFMLLGTLVLVWLGTPPAAKAIGQSLPEVDLTPLLNTDVAIGDSEIRGKVTLIHFWGTWCEPCRLEYPDFAALSRQFSDNPKVSIISVSCSPGPEYRLDELKANTKQFVEGIASEMPVYCDPAGLTRTQLALLWEGGTFGYPTTVLVDTKGTIVKVVQRYIPGEMKSIAKQIESMVK